MAKKLFLALSNLALLAATAGAQDAKTVVQNAAHAMSNVKSIQFSGTGHLSAVGQAWNPTSPWPETIVKSYTKMIDYGAQSAREELVRNEGDPPAKGGAAPFGGDQRQVNLVSGQYAWNQTGQRAPGGHRRGRGAPTPDLAHPAWIPQWSHAKQRDSQEGKRRHSRHVHCDGQVPSDGHH